jgi:tRNA G18 (ribose-2'-O)-methylase SpoU
LDLFANTLQHFWNVHVSILEYRRAVERVASREVRRQGLPTGLYAPQELIQSVNVGLMDRLPYRATVAASLYDAVRLPVAILLHNVRSMYNVGAFFRSADGAGIERLLLSGITARPPKHAITKTALGAEERVPWESAGDPRAAMDRLRDNGYEIAAIETSVRAVDIFDWQPRFPVCVVFGHEVDGLDAALLEQCDRHVRLPMLGLKHSLNVASAGAVVMYELLRKYRMLQNVRESSLQLPEK